MKNALALLALTSTFALASTADARSFRVSQVPNGGDANCLTCHSSANGGGARNAFGAAIEAALNGQNADWSKVYNLDSDGDGYSNGLELGDPDGTWVIGDADPAGTTSKPGDMNSTLCGDGILNGPEACDGDIGAAVCTDLSADHEGTVACNGCELDYTGCTLPNNSTNNATNNATNNTTNNTSNNSTNNTANNTTNNSTNNTANNSTNNSTNNGTTNTDTPVTADDEGCTAVGAAPSIWFALMALFGFRRRL